MVENKESEQSKENGIGRRSVALLVAVALGGFVGAIFFPSVEIKLVEKRVEVPVEVVKYVDKRIEVPVDRVVEKIVEKRIEVPSDKAVIRYVSDRTKEINGKPTYVISEERIKLWGQIKEGMTRQQVVGILGPPDGPPTEGNFGDVIFRWGEGRVYFYTISRGGMVKSATPPEY